jgi:hypothetical protein
MFEQSNPLPTASFHHALRWRVRCGLELPNFVTVGAILAARLTLLVWITILRAPQEAPRDAILADAAAARRDEVPAIERLAGVETQNFAIADAVLHQAVGPRAQAPDLTALHWKLVELETYRAAAALRYQSDAGESLTIYLQLKVGAPRFEMLKDGKVRVCIWQDEAAVTVVMGDLSAGQMMRG